MWFAVPLNAFRLALAAGLTFAATAVSAEQTGTYKRGPVVQTAQGPVRGITKDNVHQFLGVPYAAPPVGELRWKAPVMPAKHAMLDASRLPNICPQSHAVGVFSGPPSITEDCLYINIYTTGVGRNPGKLKPVIVWFHGGGNFTGSGNDYDGSAMARGGPEGTPAVVVTVNYRLGILGFLAHPDFLKDGKPSVNFGTLDQQAALRWIKANIAAFGGDASKVAISGQSGGSVDVHANVVSPLAAGLFSRAIFQSAPASSFVPLEPAKKRAVALSQEVGCPASNPVPCLRRLSVPRILQLQGTLKDNGPFVDPTNQNVIVDGTVVPLQPFEAYASGRYNKVPLMGGATHDEMTFVIGIDMYFEGVSAKPGPQDPLAKPSMGMTEEKYAAALKTRFGPKAPKVLDRYSSANFGGDPGSAYNRVQADPIQCGASLRALKVFAPRVPTYGYTFTYQDAPYFFPKMNGFRALAAHTIDIQFLFPGFHGGVLGVNIDQVTGQPRDFNAAETRLSQQLIGFWTNFANSGNPNKPGTNRWPAIDPAAPVVLKQDVPLSSLSEGEFRTLYNCDFWDTL